jgi:hypothetical protein
MSHRKSAPHTRPLASARAKKEAVLAVAASDPLYTSVAALVEQNKEPLRRAILTRFLRAAGMAIGQASPATLTKAASAESDLTAVLATLEAAIPEPHVASDEEVIAGAQLRGLDARQHVLDAEGGTLSAEQLARRLQLTRQAVDLRRRNHRLIGLPVGRHGYRYPVWQLGPNGVWSWLPTVIEALAPHDPWQQVFFLLSPHPDLGGETPLSTLRGGRIDEVLALARTYAAYGLG